MRDRSLGDKKSGKIQNLPTIVSRPKNATAAAIVAFGVYGQWLRVLSAEVVRAACWPPPSNVRTVRVDHFSYQTRTR